MVVVDGVRVRQGVSALCTGLRGRSGHPVRLSLIHLKRPNARGVVFWRGNGVHGHWLTVFTKQEMLNTRGKRVLSTVT
jgi:hypothetical protein